jgi:hypothetical protein
LWFSVIAVVLKATGKEKVKWTEERTETDSDGHTHQTSHHHSKEQEFFKQKVRESDTLPVWVADD